jgi:cobalt-zinc-cadmium efflux system protein
MKNLKKSFRVFLQGVPMDTDIESIKRQVLNLPGVDSIHDLHIWSMDGQYNILTLHLVSNEVNDYPKIQTIKKHIKQLLTNLNIDHITIEVDSPGNECSLDSCS